MKAFVIIVLVLWVANYIYSSIRHGRCVWCGKNRKLNHLGAHAIGIYFCKPDCITRDFLNTPYSELR